ncbi:biotin transporter BioY [Desulfoprunum benzoelyticum]|uniref:Biotin transporter n=1 Tax=Desulfoprunum benzoelyticum TaxID=1506996 RepID=A0A840V1Z1_9BACT|nr:biotin transporter BioY [Desulfoprunum benzoelyticum]MBB5347870.1 biotin transport system substrate-specific component [Desulfoprunum benzoelyticum]MBM9531740.1 biotin transporter BioY [Desulfoprunum benzoelyticum]
MNAQQPDLHRLVLASLLAALIAVGGYIAIPVGPVPIVLQNLFVLVAALLLGSRWGAAAVAVYLLAGACGLPVFAGGGGGLGHLFGPRGGYLFGFLIAAWVVGRISESFRQRPVAEIVAMVVGSLIIYAVGVPWLQMLLGLSLGKALAIGMYPFVPGDLIKIAAAYAIVKSVRPLLHFGRRPEPGRSPADPVA